MTIAEKVTQIIAAQALCEPGQLQPSDTIEKIGLDSLGMVEAIFAIEEAFDISVPYSPNTPDAPQGFEAETLGQIIQSIEALVKARG